MRYFGPMLTKAVWMMPNNSRFEGLKSSGSLAIVEDEALLTSILDYYERTIHNLVLNGRAYADDQHQTILPCLDQHLPPDYANLLAVMHKPRCRTT